MGIEDFKKEIQVYVVDRYDEFLHYKEVLNELYELFVSICQNNEIPFFLSYGSLLGEIRDNGPIAWDPDCDVSVPIQHIGALSEALKRSLPEGYFFKSNYTDKRYPFYQLRIGKKGYILDYVHLDVFYIIGAPEDIKLIKFKNKIVKLYNTRWNKVRAKAKRRPNENKWKFMLKKVYYHLKSFGKPMYVLDCKFKKLANKYNYADAHNLLCVNGEACITMPRSIIEPIQIINSNGKVVGVPNDITGYLNICYKNYQEYLPIAARFNEFYNWLNEYRNISFGDENLDYRR